MSHSNGMHEVRRSQVKAGRARAKAALRHCEDFEAEPPPNRTPDARHELADAEVRTRRDPRHWKQPFWKRRKQLRARKAAAMRRDPAGDDGELTEGL